MHLKHSHLWISISQKYVEANHPALNLELSSLGTAKQAKKKCIGFLPPLRITQLYVKTLLFLAPEVSLASNAANHLPSGFLAYLVNTNRTAA